MEGSLFFSDIVFQSTFSTFFSRLRIEMRRGARESGSDSDTAEAALEMAAAQDVAKAPSEDLGTLPFGAETLQQRFFGSSDGAAPA